jgi:hypothetical protein
MNVIKIDEENDDAIKILGLIDEDGIKSGLWLLSEGIGIEEYNTSFENLSNKLMLTLNKEVLLLLLVTYHIPKL